MMCSWQVEPPATTTKYHSKSAVFYDHYERKAELKYQTHYCPGCGHGVAHKLIAEAIEEMDVQDKTIFVSPVGCSVFAYYYFDVGNVQVAHGRAPAAATGIKRTCPDKIVVPTRATEISRRLGQPKLFMRRTAARKSLCSSSITRIYGMTGGQMAPTTLVGQKSTTSPWGRRPANEGYPLHMSELSSTLEAPVYIERVALCDNKNIMRARRAVRKALEIQRDGAGFSFVEILSPCPTIWAKDPVVARKWVAETMIPAFPLERLSRQETGDDWHNAPPVRPVAEVLEIATKEKRIARDCRNTHTTSKSSPSKSQALADKVSCCSDNCSPRWACAKDWKSAGSRHMVRKCVREARIATFVCRKKESARPVFRIPTF